MVCAYHNKYVEKKHAEIALGIIKGVAMRTEQTA